jgi:hypothetical protein
MPEDWMFLGMAFATFGALGLLIIAIKGLCNLLDKQNLADKEIKKIARWSLPMFAIGLFVFKIAQNNAY